ncbi:hypothetical protein PtB15_13B300 [Puccinia triticina]|nr:hypothetical protein PtB15_13B300 [Puccinia triticina]
MSLPNRSDQSSASNLPNRSGQSSASEDNAPILQDLYKLSIQECEKAEKAGKVEDERNAAINQDPKDPAPQMGIMVNEDGEIVEGPFPLVQIRLLPDVKNNHGEHAGNMETDDAEPNQEDVTNSNEPLTEIELDRVVATLFKNSFIKGLPAHHQAQVLKKITAPPEAGEPSQDAATEAGEPSQDAATEAGEPSRDAATEAGEPSRDAATEAGEPSQDAATEAGEPSQDAATEAGEPSQDAATEAGEPDAANKGSNEPLNPVQLEWAIRTLLTTGMVSGLTPRHQDQIFNTLAQRPGYSEPIELRYVEGPDGNGVPADERTQYVHNRFPQIQITWVYESNSD